ncbi:MAG TPA: DUF86 domain-containing protein [Chromatiales bacterium]|nr:DUF86 domain-containing protein [Chromatiales bacterium]
MDAVLFNLQVIGEAANKLPPDLLAGMPEIEWSEAAKFRDINAHHYFALDIEIIWDVVTHRIPEIHDSGLFESTRYRPQADYYDWINTSCTPSLVEFVVEIDAHTDLDVSTTSCRRALQHRKQC